MKKIKKIIDYILNIIYPTKCIFCQEATPFNKGEFICMDCDAEIDYITDDTLPNIAVFKYNEKTKASIHMLKYNNKPYYAKYFAEMMYSKISKFENCEFDLIVYVPMYFKKKAKRGYDQAELLAEGLSELINIKISRDNLIRTRNTIPQSKVKFEERKRNIEDAFTLKNPKEFEEKNIILIDDIYTSGNTIFQCAKELKKAGANSICLFTLAKVS